MVKLRFLNYSQKKRRQKYVLLFISINLADFCQLTVSNQMKYFKVKHVIPQNISEFIKSIANTY